MKTERTKYPGILRRGDRWIATIPYRDELGRRRVRWITCRTLNAARTARTDALKNLDEGVRPSDARMTLNDYLNDWLAHTERTCRPNTVRAYRGVVRRYIEPALGRVRLRDLDRRTLARFYDGQPTNGIAAACHRTLSAALGYATKELGLIAVNPCRSVSPPRTDHGEARHLDVEDARRLLDVVRGDRLEAAVILGLVGGMRIAEVVAIRWGDIDLTTGKVSVVRSAWGTTKNGKARTFTLPEPQVARLRRIKREQAERLLLLGVRQGDGTTVTAKADGTPTAHQTLAGLWTKFAADHDIAVSFHGLRHTAAILLLTSGVDVKTAAARLGHNPALLLRTYAHFVPSADRDAADRLGAALAF
jgi:integrase